MQSSWGFGTSADRDTIDARIDRQPLRPLHSAIDMVIVPDLAHDSVPKSSGISGCLNQIHNESTDVCNGSHIPIVHCALALCRRIISRTRTAYVRQSSESSCKRSLHITQRVRSSIARADIFSREPAIGWQVLVIQNGCFEKINHVLVLAIHGPITWHIERRVAGSMLREFMAPEVSVGTSLGHPVSVKC